MPDEADFPRNSMVALQVLILKHGTMSMISTPDDGPDPEWIVKDCDGNVYHIDVKTSSDEFEYNWAFLQLVSDNTPEDDVDEYMGNHLLERLSVLSEDQLSVEMTTKMKTFVDKGDPIFYDKFKSHVWRYAKKLWDQGKFHPCPQEEDM